MDAKNPCPVATLAARLRGGEGVAEVRTWIDQLRGAIVAHGAVRVAGLGRFVLRPGGESAARELAFAPSLGVLERLNGVNVEGPAPDAVAAAIVDALCRGHDAVELPGLGTFHLERRGRTGLGFAIDPELASEIR